MIKPKCTECGLCCSPYHDQDVFCDLTDADVARIPRQYRRRIIYPSVFDSVVYKTPAAIGTKTVHIERGVFKGYDFCVCKMLKGILMHKVECEIYKDRPQICREVVQPGDNTCRAIRSTCLNTLKNKESP